MAGWGLGSQGWLACLLALAWLGMGPKRVVGHVLGFVATLAGLAWLARDGGQAAASGPSPLVSAAALGVGLVIGWVATTLTAGAWLSVAALGPGYVLGPTPPRPSVAAYCARACDEVLGVAVMVKVVVGMVRDSADAGPQPGSLNGSLLAQGVLANLVRDVAACALAAPSVACLTVCRPVYGMPVRG